jgi:ankyrin repeat protein
VRPPNDADPDHPGLKIVVTDSFDEIVLDKSKHVFLDVSADWCGPSVHMKPEWHALANLLKDHDEIIISYMDGNYFPFPVTFIFLTTFVKPTADKNEIDRHYLPETFIPNIKLFPKGDKASLVSFPNSKERNLLQFISFLEQYTGVNIRASIDAKAPGYLESDIVRDLLKQLIAAIKHSCSKGALTEGTSIKQFLAMYFTNPKCFLVDQGNEVASATSPAALDEYNFAAASSWIRAAEDIVQSALRHVQPDNPSKYLESFFQQIPVVAEFLPSSEDIKHADPQLWMEAAKAIKTQNHLELKTILKDKGLNPSRNFDCRNIEDSLVCLACGYGSDKAVDILYDCGANMNELLILEGSTTMSPLEIAATVGHEKVARTLLEKGVPFRNSLARASQKGNVGIVRLLLDFGAHPDVAFDGLSPLILAVNHEHDNVIQALVEHKAVVDFNLDLDICKRVALAPNSTILHFAAKLGFISSVKAILKVWPLGSQKQNQAGKTPFDLAPVEVKCYLEEHYLDTLQALRGSAIGGLEKSTALQYLKTLVAEDRADVNAQDVRGWTPLMAAAVSDDELCCEYLLDKGAKLSTQGRGGFTALFWARVANSERAAQILESKGVSLSDSEKQGLKNIKLARNSGNHEVCSLLQISKDTGILLSAPSPEQLDQTYSTIIDRIIESAEKIETLVRNILPPNYTPKMTLEESVLAFDDPHASAKISVVESWHKDRPGEGDFPSWKSLVQHSKIFVQVVIATEWIAYFNI